MLVVAVICKFCLIYKKKGNNLATLAKHDILPKKIKRWKKKQHKLSLKTRWKTVPWLAEHKSAVRSKLPCDNCILTFLKMVIIIIRVNMEYYSKEMFKKSNRTINAIFIHQGQTITTNIMLINHFMPLVLLIYPLKTSANFQFYNIFRGNRKRHSGMNWVHSK